MSSPSASAMPRLDPAVQAAVAAPLHQMGSLLLAAFFVVTGLSADLTTLSGLGVLSAGLLLLAAWASKFVGAALAHRAFGATWREAGTVGVLLNCRGVTALIVLAIGRQAGLIGDKLFTMLVLIALLTTAALPPHPPPQPPRQHSAPATAPADSRCGPRPRSHRGRRRDR
ncbi:cation:proton antiporter [Streptomyces sp. NPDC001339]|uniref:cation:proton antiporter domain-containing protein n=1 Tax=Streptomyces sp. NPDC001339 TaxID=3364563 RepID=UPI003690355C